MLGNKIKANGGNIFYKNTIWLVSWTIWKRKSLDNICKYDWGKTQCKHFNEYLSSVTRNSEVEKIQWEGKPLEWSQSMFLMLFQEFVTENKTTK